MKKQIRYSLSLGIPRVGHSAYVELVDKHPNCKTKDVRTSEVVSVDSEGNFETLNSYYIYEPNPV
jgi:hypothetical protein